MGAAPTRLEITPEIIDLGDRVIQLSQVASVQAGTVHPWRSSARYPLAISVILLAANAVRGGGLGFDGLSILGLATLGLAVAMVFIGLKRLVIATSDGERVLITGRDMAFLRLVLDRIRLAMTSADPGLYFAIDLATSTIEAGDAAGDARASLPTLQSVPQETLLPAPASRLDAKLPPSLNGTRASAHDDALSAPVDEFGGPPLGSFADRRREAMGGAPLAVPASTPPEADPRAEIVFLIELIDHTELSHKAQIHALLDPVRDHLTGGRTGKSDARHNWALFHDYAQKYLGAVDGLPEACEKLERTMG